MLEKTKGAIRNGQFKETGNIGYTKRKTKTNNVLDSTMRKQT